MAEALVLVVVLVLGSSIVLVLLIGELSPLSDAFLQSLLDVEGEEPEPQYFGFEGRPLRSDLPDRNSSTSAI